MGENINPTVAWKNFLCVSAAENNKLKREKKTKRKRGHRPRASRCRNSSRVFWSARKAPSMQEVTVEASVFCTPRMAMHMCLHHAATCTQAREHHENGQERVKLSAHSGPVLVLGSCCFLGLGDGERFDVRQLTNPASTTTPTPEGASACMRASAICVVKRSCTASKSNDENIILF